MNFSKSWAKYFATSYVEEPMRLTMSFRGAGALWIVEKPPHRGGFHFFRIQFLRISFGTVKNLTSDVISRLIINSAFLNEKSVLMKSGDFAVIVLSVIQQLHFLHRQEELHSIFFKKKEVRRTLTDSKRISSATNVGSVLLDESIALLRVILGTIAKLRSLNRSLVSVKRIWWQVNNLLFEYKA